MNLPSDAVPIKGHEEYYVTPDGDVYSTKRKPIIKMKQTLVPDGTTVVTLHGGEGTVRPYVHHLIARAFVLNDDPEHKTTIDHINLDRADNRACNLVWVTEQENMEKDKGRSVIQIGTDGRIVAEFPSLRSAERKTGHSFARIQACCHGVQSSHNGFRWQFKKERIME